MIYQWYYIVIANLADGASYGLAYNLPDFYEMNPIARALPLDQALIFKIAVTLFAAFLLPVIDKVWVSTLWTIPVAVGMIGAISNLRVIIL